MKKAGGKTAAPGTSTKGQVNSTMGNVFGKRGAKRGAKRGGKR